jgi:signal transduction histidine kinase
MKSSQRFPSDKRAGSAAHEERFHAVIERTSKPSQTNLTVVSEMVSLTHGKLSPLQTIFEQAPEGIVVSDASGRITKANALAKQFAKVPPVGRPLQVAPDIWGEMYDVQGTHVPAERWPWMKALCGETTVRKQCQLVQSENSRYLLFSAAPLTLKNKLSGMLAVFVDITRHKGTELLLREEAIERERNRIACDMHDTLAQSLVAVLLQLEAVGAELPENLSDIRQRLGRTYELAREALAETRRSIWSFRDETWPDEDVGAALSCFAKQIFGGTPVKLNFAVKDNLRQLPQGTRAELWLIGREALTNVMKHAAASKVQIELGVKTGEVRLHVHDDGRGFVVPRGTRNHDELGLTSMRTRAQRLGGEVVVDSRPGLGTCVIARMPVPTRSVPIAA